MKKTRALAHQVQKVKILCLDLDGTLINTLPDIASAVNDLRVHLGLERLPSEVVLKGIGKGAESLIELCFPHHRGAQNHKLLMENFREILASNPQRGGEPYPGVTSTLQRLADMGITLAVITNKSTSVAQKTILSYFPGIPFAAVVGPESVSARKPSPRHLLEPLAELKMPVREAFFIGDDRVDFECACSAGVSFLWAAYGFGSVQVPSEQRLLHFNQIWEKIPYFHSQGLDAK